MITLRRSRDRRHCASGDQETWTTFDPGNPADIFQKGFRALESFHEEDLAPGAGFHIHSHKEIEVVTYVSKGTLTQKDEGGMTDLRTGEFQRRTVRCGTRHYATNGSLVDRVSAFQSSIASDRNGSEPACERKLFPMAERMGLLRLVASPDGREDSLRIHQDVRIYSSIIRVGNHLIHELGVGRGAWLHVVEGRILLLDQTLLAGDGAALTGEEAVSFTAQEGSEILLFDLA